jgi:hypothetical protein
MASGVFYGTTTNTYVKCALTWSSTPDSGTWTSHVTVTLSLMKTSKSTSHTTGTGYFRLNFAGGNYDWNAGSVDIPNDNVWRAKKTWDFGHITHGADGALAIAMSLVNSGNYSGLPSTTYTDSYVSGTAVLDTFTLPTYAIVASTGANGTVTPAGTTTVNGGASQAYAITPATGYHIADVLVDSVSVGAVASYTFSNVGAAHTISATFHADPATSFAITITSGSGGTVAGPANVVSGQDGAYTITADSGYAITDVLADGISVGAVATYTFVNVVATHTISATFTLIPAPPADPTPTPVGVTITRAHTVIASTGVITKAQYSLTYQDLATRTAHVDITHGVESIFSGDVLPNTDISLLHAVVHDATVTMVVTTTHPIVTDSQSIDFWESANVEDNTWTFLGYADDQLVGMTANNQLWNGENDHYVLANALGVTDPSALVFANLTVVDASATPLTIHDHVDATNVFRITLSYTLLNRYGPTLPSTALTFYASKPTTQWTTASFVQITGSAANGVGIEAVELYYTEGEYQEPAFLGRVNLPADAAAVAITSSSVANPSVITTTADHNLTNGETVTIAGHSGSTPTIDGNRVATVTAHDTFTIPVNVSAGGTGGTMVRVAKPWVFNWTGYQTDTSMWTIANLTPPVQNYTLGVPASKMAVLDGVPYFWGNNTYPYRIWIGGNPGNRFSVSSGTGGGFVDVDPGVGTEVKKVLKFKTQQGAAIVTALCDNANSQREARFNLVESSIAISDEQSVKGWMAEKIAGTVGCKSGNGAVAAGDGLYAVSRYGLAITTLTMEYNSQLQIMYVSDPIAPVFLKQLGHQLDLAVLFEVNGVLYMTFSEEDLTLSNIIFCYDIALKAWWTYTLDVTDPILNMIAIDYDGGREGIGIITENSVFLLPTTVDEAITTLPAHEVLIESGELTTMQPLQSMHHLAQLEFRFDYFIGDMDIVVTMIDQFGRTITTSKTVSHTLLQHQLAEYIRIDQVVESYKVVLSGHAKMRLTHFIAKLYPKSNRIGMTWGFDSQQSHASVGSIHRTFSSYNDLRDAIIP